MEILGGQPRGSESKIAMFRCPNDIDPLRKLSDENQPDLQKEKHD